MSAAPAGAPRSLARSWIPWIPLVVVLALTLGIGALGSRAPATNQDRLFAIARSYGCPVCNGETVAESNVPISMDIRTEIDRRLTQGQSDEQIREYLQARYGDYVLTPAAGGVESLVWVLPVTALIVSLAGLAVAFRRWQLPADHRATAADRDLVARALRGETTESRASGRSVTDADGPSGTNGATR